MVRPGVQHRIDEIKEVLSEIKENINKEPSNRIRKDSVLLEICTPGTCGYNGCIRSTKNRESELLGRIEELESVITKLNQASSGDDNAGQPCMDDFNVILQEKNNEIQRLSEELSKAVSTNGHLQKINSEMQFHLNKYEERTSKLEEIEKECLEHKETILRLRNEIMVLKGSIQIICRIRPKTPSQLGSRMEITDGDLRISADNKEHEFSFDKVFGPNATQSCIYREIETTLRSVLEGYSVCVFAYGQTGSGKTYTMEGFDRDPGLIIRALKDIYSAIEELKGGGWSLDITCSYVEIYNEDIVDLFSEDMKKVTIVHKDASISMSCTSMPIHNVLDAIRLFQTGARRKRVGSTNCNEKSSRSHAVYILKIKMNNEALKQQKEGSMVLVDLAGSERLSVSKAEGIRLKETQSINKSLSALGDVFNSILRKDSHIPFRNSKLTHLLQNFLSGNSRTIMLVNISPDAEHLNETICSLRFADKVGQCKLGSVRRKVTSFVSG
ncbi:kinesin-like protein [Encephalitozoon hellem ATCC 50504]|uniref:Kinesin-like protein n=1 Tax=Encephalitozoon hellem TaxID=27973 RepID=A0A9Q9C4N9_ENCHE|nr:kinesin-like protein [Encephalitozoon hellem ATCC 50504]AFM99127.1 kinesin-like protein [Encephalitozoon hellem ATCC 50504]UTX44111.1 kinesin motor Ncd [Encephalitozoon hellem]WEL39600.1 kinesin-like protein [Encephalitozoon hellem]|eukprot:XP_003888108.1 kinesin-like protein [Encephalitozoon hellem ATCC 50504]